MFQEVKSLATETKKFRMSQNAFEQLHSICTLRCIVATCSFISVLILLHFYQYSDQYFTQINKIHFPTISKVSNSYWSLPVSGSSNSPTARYSTLGSTPDNIHTTKTFNKTSVYLTKFPTTIVRNITNHENNHSSDNHNDSWLETLNYTIDYGDKTCKETKNGNPSKKIFVRLLNQWNLISKKHSIPYFLVYGSLIGAVRNADFIPWDHDMDIIVDESYYETISRIDNNRNFTPSDEDASFHLVVQNYFRSDYSNMHKIRQNCLGKAVPTQSDQCAFNGPMARLILRNIHLDIFYYEHTDDGLLIDREMEYYDENAMVHNYSDIFPLKRCMYGGVEVSCPKYPLKFLEKVYGKNVMEPPWKCKNKAWVKNI